MSPLSCEAVEDRLLSRAIDKAVREHLEECGSCRDLHHGLVALVPAGMLQPSDALLARTRVLAGAELRLLRTARRRASLGAGAKVLLAFVVALPLVLAVHALLASAFESTLGALLPAFALVAAEIAGGALSLAALSAVAFLLTLAAGAAARPPRPLEIA